MKNNANKSKLVMTIILRNIIYICWYAYAIVMLLIVNEKITDESVFQLVIAILSIHFIKEIINHFYKKIAHNAYQDYKHNIEMDYYNKLNNLSTEKINNIDKEYLANKLLEVSYNSTKIICDIGEFIVPAIIGLVLLFIVLFSLNYLLAGCVIILFIVILSLRYLAIKKNYIPSITNYNDLLKDFINKFTSIRKLNIFSFTYKELDNTQDNDIIILKHNDEINDIKFNNGVFLILAIILIGAYFIIDNNVTRVGTMIFFWLLIYKLQDLLYQVAPTILNIQDNKKNKVLLNANFTEEEKLSYENNWKKIKIIDGIVKYKTGININIPNFELTKGDQISILGKSGQGKSTVLNVLSGMLKLNDGKIIFDNKEKNKVVDACFIAKDTNLFKISLRNNICLGEKIDDDTLLKLIDEIGLTSWYKGLDKGLDTIIDEKELKINASQKQRINLLRAMITNKELIFLDEPSNDIDVDTETKVAEMIKKYLKKKTLIIVTHKPLLTTICKKHFFIQDYTLLEKEPLL